MLKERAGHIYRSPHLPRIVSQHGTVIAGPSRAQGSHLLRTKREDIARSSSKVHSYCERNIVSSACKSMRRPHARLSNARRSKSLEMQHSWYSSSDGPASKRSRGQAIEPRCGRILTSWTSHLAKERRVCAPSQTALVYGIASMHARCCRSAATTLGSRRGGVC